MYVIDAEFIDIWEVSLATCLSEIGVYSLWSDGAAHSRPSYIGQGNVVERISAHMRDDEKPFWNQSSIAGSIALLTGGPNTQRKADALVLELTLLEAAERLGVPPRHNRASGNRAALYRRGESHQTIRINVRGRHPLRVGVALPKAVRLTWAERNGGWELERLPWNSV